jgi:hypothetical protein
MSPGCRKAWAISTTKPVGTRQSEIGKGIAPPDLNFNARHGWLCQFAVPLQAGCRFRLNPDHALAGERCSSWRRGCEAFFDWPVCQVSSNIIGLP